MSDFQKICDVRFQFANKLLGILVGVSVCKLVSVRAMKKVCRKSKGIAPLILNLSTRWRRSSSGPVTLSPEPPVCVYIYIYILKITHS